MSTQNEIYTIPKGWVWTTIGEITLVKSGGTPNRKNLNFYQGDIPWVKSGELNFNVIHDTEEKISIQALENSNAKILGKGAILIALYGATVGKLAILGTEACTNQAIAGITCTDSLNNKYVYYYLLKNRDKLLKQRQGGAQPNISQKIITEFQIPIPELRLQTAIVTKIEEVFSELDHLEAVLRKSQNKLKVYKQALLEKALQGQLIPSDKKNRSLNSKVQKTSIDAVCTLVTDGSHYSPASIKDGYPYITVKDIKNDRIDFANSKRVSDVDFLKLKSSGCMPYKGDVLFSKDGTVGKVSTVDFDKDFVVLSSIAILRPDQTLILPSFLFYTLKSPSLLKQALDNKKGVAIRRIILRDLKNLKINLLPLDEQYEIVQLLETNFTLVENFEKTLSNELKKIDLLRQSILKKAYRGLLVTDIELLNLDFYNNILEEKKVTLEKLESIPKPKKKPKHRPIDLLEIIKKEFKDKEFSIEDLKEHIEISDDELKDRFFKILEDGKSLNSTFDIAKETRLYKMRV